MLKDDASIRARKQALKAELRELEWPAKKAAKLARQRERHKRSNAQVGGQGQREPRQRDKVYLSWIRRLPCIACVARGVSPEPSEAAHIRAGYSGEDGWRPTGMGEKPHDWRTAPLCPMDHRSGPNAQHGANERRWWEDLGVYPPDLCADLRAAFNADQDGAEVIINHVRRR